MVKIGIILGSTRTQSNGRALFNYLQRNLDQWQTDEAITTAFLDLAHYQLPFFDEPEPPMANPPPPASCQSAAMARRHGSHGRLHHPNAGI